MAAESAGESLELGLPTGTAVVFLASSPVAMIVAAEVAGKTESQPVTATVGDVVVLIDVVTAAVEDHTDATVANLTQPRPDTLAPALVAGRFGIRIGI